eukprot:TRINITY_DN14293_c0_g1_i1.p2 TRINITY_DN14293_c0_g1~~TRINITY_DN14293_c0_g1_i1.p2  ORF type:complete len:128 (+),score=29.65 TRINITY_DN14293_c0_g1_i1:156-539(+)
MGPILVESIINPQEKPVPGVFPNSTGAKDFRGLLGNRFAGEPTPEQLSIIVDNIKKKGFTQWQLRDKFKEFDRDRKGTVTLDTFFVVFMKLDTTISKREVEALIRRWNPEALNAPEINYEHFLSSLF